MITDTLILNPLEINDHADHMKDYITGKIREKHPRGEIVGIEATGIGFDMIIRYQLKPEFWGEGVIKDLIPLQSEANKPTHI